jgi:hypothetical protein
VNSASDTGGTPVPVFGSHTSPPLQPPETHAFGPLSVEKSQSRRPWSAVSSPALRAGTEAAHPDAAGLPVVRGGEGHGLVRGLLPADGVVGNGGADVQVREYLRMKSYDQHYGRPNIGRIRVRTAGQMVNGQLLYTVI